jgi:hypothetical protein
MTTSLNTLYLPSGLLDHFEYLYHCEFCLLSTREVGILIHLDEKNELPSGFVVEEYESKGFDKPVLIQDFPIRGKLVFLSIRKRRWRKKSSKNEVIKRDHSFITEGLQMTADLSAFLKGTGRESSRYDVEYL